MSEDKLDRILDQLKALGPIQYALEDLRASIRDVREEVVGLKFVVDNHGDRILALEKDMQLQKDMANVSQQQLRALTLRLMNFPVVDGEASDNYAGLRTRVYESVLKPLLVAAKAAKDLPSVPQMATAIEACFRPFNATVAADSSVDAPPPHVIIKISSRPIKIALLKHRKHLPKPVPDDAKRIFLVEDLTQATHKALTAISKSKAAGKVWTIDGTIKFTLGDDPTVRTVKSVFDPLNKMLRK